MSVHLMISELEGNVILASCPWGPVTANWVHLLTEIYVIYIEVHTSQKFMSVGPLAAAGEPVTDAITEGKLGNI